MPFQKLVVVACSLVVLTLLQAPLDAQFLAKATKKTIKVTFVGGWERPGADTSSPEVGLALPALQSLFPGYDISIVTYSWDGNNMTKPGTSLAQDFENDSTVLSFAACYSSGCNTINNMLLTEDPLSDSGRPEIQNLLAIDPYTPPLFFHPLSMQLDPSTNAWMVFSGKGLMAPGLPPTSGNVVSTLRVPTDHGNLLKWLSDTLILINVLEDMMLSQGPLPGRPADPAQPSPPPLLPVPSPLGAGNESGPIWNVASDAFRSRSNLRYFHLRPSVPKLGTAAAPEKQ